MDSLWWKTPGPDKFVSRIVNSLFQGQNVILLMPEYAPSSLSRTLKARCDERESEWDWYYLEDFSDNGSPLELLSKRFTQNGGCDLPSAYSLATDASFSGRLIWVRGLDVGQWGLWKRFIVDYELACRSVGLLERTLFCIELVGEMALDPPAVDLCLALHSWKGCVEEMDMLLYTANLYRDHNLPSLHKQVCISIASKLACFDPSVAYRLAFDDHFNGTWDSRPVLLEMANERFWSDKDVAESEPNWASGHLDFIGQEGKLHSGFLAAIQDHQELDRRCWAGQVGTILPFVEERRRDILNLIGKHLTVPFVTSTGTLINEVERLELNHIMIQVNERGLRLEPPLFRLLYTLRDLRNALSHLETCHPSSLNSKEMRGYRSII